MSPPYKELFKLYDLIQSGEPSSVHQFLSRSSVDLNHVLPSKGIGVLHLAVGIDPEEKATLCTEMLLKHGADPNLCTEDGVTPVHIAAIWGRAAPLRLLLGCGGDAARRDLDRCSAFDYAAAHDEWRVFDHLHNVVDQNSESCGARCEYQLDLDKVIVTTDDLSAEYSPAPASPAASPATSPAASPALSPAPRRSQAVRDWCAAASLTINQLYPTILGDTYSVDDDPEPWRSEALPLDSSGGSSYATAAGEVRVSGVRPLADTDTDTDTDIDSDECRAPAGARLSVYENFSLPGSPCCITHANYRSKTSLRARRAGGAGCGAAGGEGGLHELGQQLDALAQNKTNEWLSRSACESCCGGGGGGGRGSGGGGGVAVARVREVYTYTDPAEDVVLTETRDLVAPLVLPMDDSASSVSAVSVASSLPAALRYDNASLRAELLRRGFNPGPVTAATRHLYLKKLRALRRCPVVERTEKKTYSEELQRTLRDARWTADLGRLAELDACVRRAFAEPGAAGGAKTSFTYLLLDPRVTRDLPGRAAAAGGAGGAGGGLDPQECWRTFIDSIFYVGKGKRSRPYAHLYQALALWKRDFASSPDRKVQRILDVWRDRGGVVCLHVFQNVPPAEAFTHEAAMMDALTLGALTNQRRGQYHGEPARWPGRRRRLLGVYLLHRALNIFLSEGERQLRPGDVD